MLDALPWEYASGPSGCVARSCSFVRGLPKEQRSSPPAILSGLHIVAVASSPLSHDLAPLNIEGEWTRLTEIVGSLDRAVTLERAWPPTIVRLRELVAGQQQRVVHFMGHGGQNKEGEAVLCFERDDGTREDIAASNSLANVPTCSAPRVTCSDGTGSSIWNCRALRRTRAQRCLSRAPRIVSKRSSFPWPGN